MTDYSFMEETVDKICYSLENEGHKWEDTSCTLDGFGFRIWKDTPKRPFTDIWNGNSREQVFSKGQGDRILESFNKFKQKNARESQKEVINKMKTTSELYIYSKWWEFWK